MDIKSLTKQFAVTPRTLRYYEELGLLKPEHVGQQRIYSEQDQQRLEFVLQAKGLGFSLADLAELFELYDDSQTEETQIFRFMHVLRTKQRELDVKQANLDVIKNQIDHYEQQCLKHIKEKGLIG